MWGCAAGARLIAAAPRAAVASSADAGWPPSNSLCQWRLRWLMNQLLTARAQEKRAK